MSHVIPLMQSISQSFAGEAHTPLLTVAAYAGSSLILYSLTRGKEFLVAGYSSVLFLIPFVHLA